MNVQRPIPPVVQPLWANLTVLCSRQVRSNLSALCLLVGLLCGSASAQSEPKSAKAAPEVPVVTVTAPRGPACAVPADTACAVRRLQQAADQALKDPPPISDPQIYGPGSADIHTGVASQTATRQRLGGHYGVSVHPPRPNRPPPANRP